MDRILETELLEGEIGLVIDYLPGSTSAIDVLQAAMGMIEALDRVDAALLSSVDTNLQPISVLNDVQHSSLKILLARALKHIPDEVIHNLEWKKWIGGLLVKGKHLFLSKVNEIDAPEIKHTLDLLEPEYRNAPASLPGMGYAAPTVISIQNALGEFVKARAALPGQKVTVQTELGDIIISDQTTPVGQVESMITAHEAVNTGTEIFKVKMTDMIGSAQWTIIRDSRPVRVNILHQNWLEAYHRRDKIVLPGDCLRCKFEERIAYNVSGTELNRKLDIIEVMEIISPPKQQKLC